MDLRPSQNQCKVSCNAGQNNLVKTNCVFLSRKGDFSELPLSPNFSVVFGVFVCEYMRYDFNTDKGEGERRFNVRGKENVQDSIKSSWIF